MPTRDTEVLNTM